MRLVLSLAGAFAMVAAAGVSAVHAQPTPPTRFFGTATVDGRPAADGTTVTASVGTNACGTGQVTGGAYTVDVASASTRSGCGTDGATVTFTVGSARATQTGTFQTGAFVSLNLTAQAGTPTPTATPTRTPTPVATTPRPATPVATTPRPATPVATVATPRPPTPAPTVAPVAPRLPTTGTSTGADGGLVFGGLAALALLGAGAGMIAFRRR
jgi:hypothetical protein